MKITSAALVPFLIRVSLCRCFFLDKIQEKLPNTLLEDSMEVDGGGDTSSKMEVDNESEDANSMIRSCKFTMKMKMIESARKQVSKPT